MQNTPRLVTCYLSHHTLSARYQYFGVHRGFSTVQAFDFTRAATGTHKELYGVIEGGLELATMRTDGT
jgi:hypothetical protein